MAIIYSASVCTVSKQSISLVHWRETEENLRTQKKDN